MQEVICVVDESEIYPVELCSQHPSPSPLRSVSLPISLCVSVAMYLYLCVSVAVFASPRRTYHGITVSRLVGDDRL